MAVLRFMYGENTTILYSNGVYRIVQSDDLYDDPNDQLFWDLWWSEWDLWWSEWESEAPEIQTTTTYVPLVSDEDWGLDAVDVL